MTPLELPRPKRTPLLIAHRGANREAPENTLPAIRRALELGADGIEMDCLLTADDIPIIAHNNDLSLLTSSRGRVHATPFAALRSLDAGGRSSPEGSSATMPLLAEALELIAPHEVLTIIEIKAQRGKAGRAARIVGETAGAFALKGTIMISSASLRVLRELHRCHPRIPRAFVLRRPPLPALVAEIATRAGRLSGLHASLFALSPKLVQRARENRLQLFAWTANSPGELDRCLEEGVDGIITDDIGASRLHLAGRFGSARA